MTSEEKAAAWREAHKAWLTTMLIAGILAFFTWEFATSGFDSDSQKQVAHYVIALPACWAAFQLLGFYRYPRQNFTNLVILILCGVIFLLSGCSQVQKNSGLAPAADVETKRTDEQNQALSLINHCRDIVERRGGVWPKSHPQTLAEAPCTIEEVRGERRKFVEAYYRRHPDHKREVER